MPGIQAPLALRWVLHSPGALRIKFDPVQVRDSREFDYLRVSMAEAKVAGSPTSQAGPGESPAFDPQVPPPTPGLQRQRLTRTTGDTGSLGFSLISTWKQFPPG